MGKRKKQAIDHNVVIQFRPGEGFGRMIHEFSQTWRVSRNEAARRLALLGAFNMGVAHYPAIEQLASGMGSTHEFFAAAQQARAALDSSDRTRLELNNRPLTEGERVFYLEGWVNDFLAGKTQEDLPYRKFPPQQDPGKQLQESRTTEMNQPAQDDREAKASGREPQGK